MSNAHIFVNGILTFPGSADNWTGRAVTWVHKRRPTGCCDVAEKVEYLSGATVTRALLQKKRARKLFGTVSHLPQFKIHLYGHSNGADVIRDCLIYHPNLSVHRVVLIAPAISEDMDSNGLNTLLETRRIEELEIHYADRDGAMRLAGSLFGKMFGYGDLGKDGAKHVSDRAYAHLKQFNYAGYGHSTFWDDRYFESTMSRITGY